MGLPQWPTGGPPPGILTKSAYSGRSERSALAVGSGAGSPIGCPANRVCS